MGFGALARVPGEVAPQIRDATGNWIDSIGRPAGMPDYVGGTPLSGFRRLYSNAWDYFFGAIDQVVTSDYAQWAALAGWTWNAWESGAED